MVKTGKKILIIEDETTLKGALEEKFSSEGFSIISAPNGKEGLEMALKEHPDLILLDVIMPEMDGISMLEKLRRDSWGKQAEVIMLTNLSDPESWFDKDAIDGHGFEYLIKTDWKLDEIVNKVKKKLDV